MSKISFRREVTKNADGKDVTRDYFSMKLGSYLSTGENAKKDNMREGMVDDDIKAQHKVEYAAFLASLAAPKENTPTGFFKKSKKTEAATQDEA